MVYITGGQVTERRSPYRLSIIPELFWSIINGIYLFFRTLIDPSFKPDPKKGSTDYYRRDGGGGGPPSNVRGMRKGGGASAPPAGGG